MEGRSPTPDRNPHHGTRHLRADGRALADRNWRLRGVHEQASQGRLLQDAANRRMATSRIARGDLTEEIAALKSESGGDIMAHGGAAFVQALSRLGLIDTYHLIIHPVALGNGLPLFKDLAKPLRVDLAEARRFPDGTVIHVYQPIRTTG